MERRLAAILAADVKGYSHLTELNEEASTATLRMYRAVVEELISAHKGHVFSSAGDSVVAEFPSIVEAIRCAVEIQNEIAERNASVPKNEQMQFRIGVNLGDVIAEENNLYGTGVNVAVRLEQLADAGGICISQTVYDQIRKIVEMPFEDIGERRLKNIAEPVHVYRILPSPLPWLKRLLLRTQDRRRLGVAAGVLLMLLAAAAGAFYLRQPAALWDGILDGRASLPEHPAIAVLPFSDMSATHDQQYLADGITEELITGLAKFPELIVMSRNATSAYKDKPTDTRLVGKDLNVHYVVEGSIQRSNQNARVTAQLIDASTGHQLWADKYDRHVDNIFAIRDDITMSIVGTLGGLAGKLAQAEVARVSAKNPNSFTAYDYLMRGWYEWHKFTREGNAAALGLFEQARKIDPELRPRLRRPRLDLCRRLRLRVDGRLRQDSQARARDGQHGRPPRSQRLSSSVGTWLGISIQPATREGCGTLRARSRPQSERRGAARGDGQFPDLRRPAETSNRASNAGNPAQSVSRKLVP